MSHQDSELAGSFDQDLEWYGRHAASEAFVLREIAKLRRIDSDSDYPSPIGGWIDATADCHGQWRAYDHLAPQVAGGHFLQVGGSGLHACKALLAGADRASLLTPVASEADAARQMATAVGVGDRLDVSLGVAEDMPYRDAQFNCAYAGGTFHHTILASSVPEVLRVLVPGGRFSAVDPYKAPGHSLGTRLLGKREVGVTCTPLDTKRVCEMFEALGTPQGHERVWVENYGFAGRFAVIVLEKAGVEVGLARSWSMMAAADRLGRRVGVPSRWGSLVVVLGVAGTN